MEYDISIVSNEDVSDIVSLFLTSDPRHSRSTLYYSYSNNFPHASSLCAVAKNHDGRIVGHYSILLLKFKRLNKIYNVGYAQQAIVHKKYRNLKLISELHNFAIERVKDRLDFVFAFSNDNFLKIKTKIFGWSDLGSFFSDVVDLRMINFEVDHKIESLQKFENGFTPNENKLSIIKTEDYLNHRLLENPVEHYKTFIIKENDITIGYISLKFYKRDDEVVGHFIDFEAKNIEILMSLVAKSKEYFSFYGVHKVIFWNRTEYQQLFNPYIVEKGFSTNLIVKNFSNNKEILNKDLWSLPMILSDAF
jgi:hypothetical protein